MLLDFQVVIKLLKRLVESSKLCISMHLTIRSLHPMHCIYVSGSYLHVAIDHVEQGHMEPPEPALVEAADYEQDQGNPRCI
jgi:hypothetical protein